MNKVAALPMLPDEARTMRLRLLDYLREFAQSINQGAEGVLWPFVAVSAAYTAGPGDLVIICTGGPYTVTLAPVRDMQSKRVIVKRGDSGTSTITIAAASIDGAASVTLTTAWQSREMFSDGTQWLLV